MDRVRDGRCNPHNRRFARARRRNIFAIDQNHLDFRSIMKPRHSVLRQPPVENASVPEINCFEQERRPAPS